MRRRILHIAAVAATVFVLAVPSPASAGDITLHPSGFGEHSYAAWKADQGLPDNAGNKDQALYFQKETSTATFAAGVAVFKGVAGLETSEIDPLGFWYRSDGHCGAGAPRFNLRFDPDDSGPLPPATAFFGCNSGMAGVDTMMHEGRIFFERNTVAPLPSGTVISLAIIFDEGTEFPNPYVHLDNIRVGTRVWKSANDNGNGGTTTANTAVTTAELVEILGEPLSVAFGS
jgi:hypothetical protein